MAKSPEKPPFSVVSTIPVQVPDPPRPLGAHGQQLWSRVQREYAISDVGGVEILAQICAAQDRVETLRERIDADGETVHTRGGMPRAHPALRDELQLRSFIVKSLEKLGLNVEAVKSPGRPPAGGLGWIPPR
jgi:P27 family predicted phage terminase small subunit